MFPENKIIPVKGHFFIFTFKAVSLFSTGHSVFIKTMKHVLKLAEALNLALFHVLIHHFIKGSRVHELFFNNLFVYRQKIQTEKFSTVYTFFK